MKFSDLPIPEQTIHEQVADLLTRLARPSVLWTHIPSGELRNKATAAKLKRMGVKPNWPDFIFVFPGAITRMLELKREGGRQSTGQLYFHCHCEAHGIEYRVAKSFDEAMQWLLTWGVLRFQRNTAGLGGEKRRGQERGGGNVVPLHKPSSPRVTGTPA